MVDWLLPHAGTVWRRVARGATDEYGKPDVQAPELFECYWEEGEEIVHDDQAKALVADHVVYADGDFSVASGDFILKGDHTATPDPFAAGAHAVMRVYRNYSLLDGDEGLTRIVAQH